MSALVVLGPSRCEGYYHGDDSDPDTCDAYEASESPAPCEAFGVRCCEFYPPLPAPVAGGGKDGGK